MWTLIHFQPIETNVCNFQFYAVYSKTLSFHPCLFALWVGLNFDGPLAIVWPRIDRRNKFKSRRKKWMHRNSWRFCCRKSASFSSCSFSQHVIRYCGQLLFSLEHKLRAICTCLTCLLVEQKKANTMGLPWTFPQSVHHKFVFETSLNQHLMVTHPAQKGTISFQF